MTRPLPPDLLEHLRKLRETPVTDPEPPPQIKVRWHPGRAAVVGMLLIVLLSASIFAWRWWALQPESPQPVEAASSPISAATSHQLSGAGSPADKSSATVAANPGSVGESAGTASADSSQIKVHIEGQVKRPGVVSLSSSSRVQDAVKAAGGFTSKADRKRVNLARKITDGEQIYVPAPGEELPQTMGSSAAGGAVNLGGKSPERKVNLNTADASRLQSLPGVGPVLAQRIVEYRQTKGRFVHADDLAAVSGIGPKLYARLRPLVRV